MKVRATLVTLLFILGLVSVQAKEYRYSSVPNDPLKMRIYTLDNGLKIYLSVNTEKPRIQTYIAVKTGSRNDPKETTGLAHYLEHLMFKGTKKFGTNDPEKEAPLLQEIENRYEKYRLLTDSKERRKAYHEIDSISQIAAKYFIPNEYDKLMSSIGSEGTNAYTSDDITCYIEDIPSNEIDNWAKIQSDRFQNMVIRGFHTELEAVYEEYNIGIARDQRKTFAALSKLLTPTHPYGTQTTIGTQEHLKNPSITNIKNYYNRYYVPNNIAICMSGDFNPDEVIKTIDKYFGLWKRSENLSYPIFAPQEEIINVRDTTVLGLEAENIMMAWRFKGASNFQNDTVSVIAEMLSNGKAGLMDLNLNQKMKYLGGGAFTSQSAEYSAFILYGNPKERQSLNEVKTLLLEQISNLKSGKFSSSLLPSVINNIKLDFYKSLEDNSDRAGMAVDAFINNKKWEDVVNRLNRISNITKEEIVNFANKYLKDNNYVVVYKQQGIDTTLKKIDKPQITPIPSNRNMQSDFVSEIISSKITPISPVFIDFNKDLKHIKDKHGMPVIYVQNKENELFTLEFRLPIGTIHNKKLPFATSYLKYLGTNKFNAEEIKQKFYELACSYSISVKEDFTTIKLSGLNEKMPKALALLNNILSNTKADEKAYSEYIELIKKTRKDELNNQSKNNSALMAYGLYGKYNYRTNVLTDEELKKTNPNELVSLLKNLKTYSYSVLYYGPLNTKELINVVTKNYNTVNKKSEVPKAIEYKLQTTSNDEILFAQYDAKNIYMSLFHNENKIWNIEDMPVVKVFNEYFGGGMNGIVFQELRETRGLAYSAGSRYTTPDKKNKPEYIIASIITQNDKMMDCINEFRNIINNMPISEKAFELSKQAVGKRIATERTTKFEIINKYLQAQKLGIDYDLNKKIYEALPHITMEDLINFEKKNIANKSYKYIILGDEKELDMNNLGKIGKIKRITQKELFNY